MSDIENNTRDAISQMVNKRITQQHTAKLTN